MRNTEYETLDDIIFENRNKDYGAYALRKNYTGYLYRAVMIGVGVFVLIFGGAWTYQKYNHKAQVVPGKTATYDPVYVPPQGSEKKPESTLKTPARQDQPKRIDAIIPVPEADELVEIEQPAPSQVQLEKAIISTETKGDGDVTAFDAIHEETVAEKAAESEKPEENEIHLNAEEQPMFPGGQSEMYRFINANIKYPGAAQRQNVSGRVFVKFVIEKDGSIGKVEVLKGIGFGCDEEAVRVIRSMPRWNPGRQNGKNVRVYYNMPIFYQLE